MSSQTAASSQDNLPPSLDVGFDLPSELVAVIPAAPTDAFPGTGFFMRGQSNDGVIQAKDVGRLDDILQKARRIAANPEPIKSERVPVPYFNRPTYDTQTKTIQSNVNSMLKTEDKLYFDPLCAYARVSKQHVLERSNVPRATAVRDAFPTIHFCSFKFGWVPSSVRIKIQYDHGQAASRDVGDKRERPSKTTTTSIRLYIPSFLSVASAESYVNNFILEQLSRFNADGYYVHAIRPAQRVWRANIIFHTLFADTNVPQVVRAASRMHNNQSVRAPRFCWNTSSTVQPFYESFIGELANDYSQTSIRSCLLEHLSCAINDGTDKTLSTIVVGDALASIFGGTYSVTDKEFMSILPAALADAASAQFTSPQGQWQSEAGMSYRYRPPVNDARQTRDHLFIAWLNARLAHSLLMKDANEHGQLMKVKPEIKKQWQQAYDFYFYLVHATSTLIVQW